MPKVQQKTHLTEEECSKIIGGLLTALVTVCSDADTVRNAVGWWADSEEAWAMLEAALDSARHQAEAQK